MYASAIVTMTRRIQARKCGLLDISVYSMSIIQYYEIPAGVDGSMVSNVNRKAWEDQFQRWVLAPHLQVNFLARLFAVCMLSID